MVGKGGHLKTGEIYSTLASCKKHTKDLEAKKKKKKEKKRTTSNR